MHQHGHVFAQPEKPDSAGKIGRFGARSHAGSISDETFRLPPVDVADDIKRDVHARSPQLPDGVEEHIDALGRDDLTDEDDAARHSLSRLPSVRAMGNGVVDDARLISADAVEKQLALGEIRIRDVLIDAWITRVLPQPPVETSRFGRVPSLSTTRMPKRRNSQSAGTERSTALNSGAKHASG